MFPEFIAIKNLKYVYAWIKSLFSGKILAAPLAGRLKYFIINWGTLTQDQNIFKVSNTTEKANGDLLFTKTTASDSGRNSGNVEKRCTSQNNTKTQQQPVVLQQFVFSKEVEWRKPSCDQFKRSE